MRTPEEKLLGQKVEYPEKYAPEILVAVPRILNRSDYGIENENLPFDGFDTWHGYEFSFLLNNGLPVVGILKLVYSASSPFLVESKSLKLYLNSFNMMPMGDDEASAVATVLQIVQADISEVVQSRVAASFFNSSQGIADNDFSAFPIIEQNVSFTQNAEITHYSEQYSLLQKSAKSGIFRFGSHLLRSNCKVTHQPDWGSVFVELTGISIPEPVSFLKYIVSLRNENHFHEEICELIFKRLLDRFEPDGLMVACLYTRRGGIDINPVRYMRGYTHTFALGNSDKLTHGVFRQ